MNSIVESRLLSSLEKVFPDEELSAFRWEKGSALADEVYSFQIALRIPSGPMRHRSTCPLPFLCRRSRIWHPLSCFGRWCRFRRTFRFVRIMMKMCCGPGRDFTRTFCCRFQAR